MGLGVFLNPLFPHLYDYFLESPDSSLELEVIKESVDLLSISAREFVDIYNEIPNPFNKREIYRKRHFDKYVKWTITIETIYPSTHREGFSIYASDKGFILIAEFEEAEDERVFSLKKGEKVTVICKLSNVSWGDEEGPTVIFIDECHLAKDYS